MTPTVGAEALDVVYRSQEWHELRRTCVAASEAAAVLGLSPWTSPFDLYWLKQTGEASEPDSAEMRRGRRLEALILEDFAEAHPEFTLLPSATYRSGRWPWQLATPDAVAAETGAGAEDPQPVAVVEAKTAGSRAEWGEPGTDQVPVYYRAQVLWQMDVLGVEVAYLPVWFGTTYAEYVVTYDPRDVDVLRREAAAFLDRVATGDPPPIDEATATTRRLKHLHPTVEAGEVEVPPGLVAQYNLARRLRDAAVERMRLAENRLRHAIGDREAGTINGIQAVKRSVFDVPEKTIPRRGYTVNRLNVRSNMTSEET